MSSNLPADADSIQQVTIEYPNSRVAQMQIGIQSANGLQVKSMTTVNQNVGCLRFFLFGIWAFVFKPEPHVLVVYEGRTSVIQGAQRAKAEYTASVIQAAKEKQDAHMASLNQVQRWLHTIVGIIATLVVYLVGLVLAFNGHTNFPYLLVGLAVALAVADWQDFASFHGAIPWARWKAEGKNWSYYGLGATLWLCGWLFMPVVYAIQAWQSIKGVKATLPPPEVTK